MIRHLDPMDALKVAEFLTYIRSEDWELKGIMTEIKCHKALGCFLENELVAILLYRDLVDILEISWLCTRPTYRRQGIMKSLLKKLSEECRKGQNLWLELRESNTAALRLYEHHGFSKVGQRKAYYSNGENATLMEFKPLQSL